MNTLFLHAVILTLVGKSNVNFYVTALKHSPSKRKSLSRPMRALESEVDMPGKFLFTPVLPQVLYYSIPEISINFKC